MFWMGAAPVQNTANPCFFVKHCVILPPGQR
jgi:hypothetical protein